MNNLTIDEYDEVLKAINEKRQQLDKEYNLLRNNITPTSDKGVGIVKRALNQCQWEMNKLDSAWNKLCAVKVELENKTPFEER